MRATTCPRDIIFKTVHVEKERDKTPTKYTTR
jgi:hypothetical protein